MPAKQLGSVESRRTVRLLYAHRPANSQNGQMCIFYLFILFLLPSITFSAPKEKSLAEKKKRGHILQHLLGGSSFLSTIPPRQNPLLPSTYSRLLRPLARLVPPSPTPFFSVFFLTTLLPPTYFTPPSYFLPRFSHRPLSISGKKKTPRNPAGTRFFYCKAYLLLLQHTR
jgi:hypothetical protein